MKRKILFGFGILLIIIFVIVLFSYNNKNGWNKKDLYIYNLSGNIIERPHTWDENVPNHAILGTTHCDICKDIDNENAATHRGVKIGDDAIEALSKYNLNGAYYRTNDGIKELTSIEEIIKQNKTVSIYIWLDKKFKVLEQPTNSDYKYQIEFFIRDKVIEEYAIKEIIK